MKKTILISVILLFGTLIYSQNFIPNGGEYKFNKSKQACLTNNQRSGIKIQLQNNIKRLKAQNKLAFGNSARGNHALFAWPIQKAVNVTYNDVWAISNYVDHNSAFPNQLSDYNCGTKTYDTNSGYNHQGIDVFTWPFTWKMLDDDSVEIIAAAAGQIIAKGDNQFDRSCSFNNNTWNAVYIQHSDGSIAWYGHMKQSSATTKNVGDMVSQGEYLGVVGSSGNSTGPHLHFEVYQDDSYTQLIDPYYGTCNNFNTDSWWLNQKPYTNPNINAVLTHTAPPVFPACPTTETTNESNQFETTDTIYFGLYMRDQENGTSVNLKIIKPDNSILYNWDFGFTANYTASWWYWWYSGVYDMEGEWKWEATYQGQTVTHTFNVGTLSIEDETLNSTSIYPNPFNTVINISSTQKIIKATVVDMLGKVIKSVSDSFGNIREINLENNSNGMYFLLLESNNHHKKIIKIIKIN